MAPAWAALSLLAGLLGLLALLSPVAAQSVTATLVSNAGQGRDSNSNEVYRRAQAFTTTAGATLSSVEIISEDTEGDDVAVSLCTVDASDRPTSSCTDLTAPLTRIHRSKLDGAGCRAGGEFGGCGGARRAVPGAGRSEEPSLNAARGR